MKLNKLLLSLFFLNAIGTFVSAQDDPCNAVNINPGQCLNGNNTGMTNSGNNPGCANYSGGDYWFQVTVPASGNLSFETGDAGGFTDGGLAIWTGPCNALTNVACDDDGGTGTFSLINQAGLIPGSTVFIQVWEYGNNSFGPFELCVTDLGGGNPVNNSDPCNATPITVDGPCLTGDNTGAPGTTFDPGCANWNGGDVWYEFTVPASGVFDITTTAGGITDAGMAIWVPNPNCNSLSLIDCDDDGGTGAMPFIQNGAIAPGSTVYIQVWEYGNNSFGTFDICVTEPTIVGPCVPTGTASGNCGTANPFCTGNTECFPASTNTTAEPGNDYGCLSTQPNPAWYYLEIDQNGPITIDMFSTPSVDIDFALWGPFADLATAQGNCGSLGAPLDCSYSTSATETANIPNGQAGEVYLFLITNFSGSVTDITFSQTGGTGTTDCSIILPCDISAMTANASPCNGANVYDISGNITFTDPPSTGTLTVTDCNGNSTVYNAPFTSPHAYTITGATADGAACNVTATFSDAGACTFTTPVNAPAPMSVATVPTNESCDGACDGSITANVTNGVAGFNYNWNNGAANVQSPNGLCPNTYTVTVTDNNGCTATNNGTINAGTTITAALPGVANQCLTGNSFNFNGSGSTISTGTITSYSWDFGDSNTGTGATPNHTYGAAGTYTVTLTVSDGTCTDQATINVTVYPMPTVTASGTNVDCNGANNGTVNAVGAGTSGYSYSWDNGAGNNASATGLGPNTYTVTVTDVNGCTATDSYTVTEPPVLTASITAQTNADCNGNSTGSVTVAGAGGTPGYQYDIGGAQQASGTFNGLAAGNYTVTVEDNNGCTTTVPVTITEPTALTASITAQTNVDCNGASTGSVTVAGANGTPGYLYDIGGAQQASGTFNGLAAGNYTVTVEDSQGCTTTVPVTITEPTALTGSITIQTNVDCNGASTGSVTVAGANGTPGYLYDIGGAQQASGTFNGLAAGNYTVTIEDNNGCTTTVPVTITEPTALTASITAQTNVNCNGDATGSVTIAGANGTPGYLYDIGGAQQASGTFNGLTAGNYTVTVEDNNGCTTTVPVTITEPPVLTISLTSSNDATCGLPNGDLTVSAAGGTAPLNFDIGGAQQASGTFGSLTPGSYTVTVTDNNGCTATINVVIADLSGLTGNITAQTDVDCNGNPTGSVTVLGSGSLAPYTYDIGSGFQASGTFNGLTAGNYTVTVQDGNGCLFPVAVTIAEPTALTASITLQTNVDCNGASTGSVTIAGANGTPGYTYDIGSGPQASGTFNGLAAGNYTVTVEDNNGCTTTVPVTITEPTALTGSITAQTNVDCNGNSTGSVTIAGANGTPGYTYDIGGGPQASGTFNGLAAGNYTVTIEDNNGCTTTVPVTITEPTAITGSITAQTNVDCNGNSTGSVTIAGANGTPGYTYDIGGGPQASGTFNGLAAGNYTVAVEDNNGCTTTVLVTITEPTPLTISLDATTDASCAAAADGGLTVSANGGTPNYSFDIGGAQQASGTFNGLAANNYTVTVTDNNGCTATVNATINQAASLTLSITGTDATCNGGCDGSADATINGGTLPYTTVWQHGPTSEDLTGVLCAGTYTLDITDGNGCTATANVTINEPGAITSSVAGTDVTCNGANDGTATVTANGGTGALSFSWAPAPGGGQGTNAATGLVGGTLYTCTITDNNGCTTTETFTPNEPAALTVATTPVNSNCGQADGSASATGNGGTAGYNFEWYDNAALTNNIGSGNSIAGLAAGTYYVEITDNNGCTASNSVNIVDNNGGSIAHTQTAVTCNGGSDASIDITITGGTPAFTYAWTGPGAFTSANEDLSGLAAGSYDVTVTDNVGCVLTHTVIITEPTALSVSANGTDANCFGSADGSVSATGSGGTPAYTIDWYDNPALTSGVGTGSPLNGLAAGTYYVEITDNNGCTASSSITINEPAQIVPVLSSTDANCGQADGSVSVTSVSGGSGNYVSEVWEDALGNPVANINAVPGGSYTVTVTDDNGCTGTATIGVNNNTGPTLSILAQTSTSCAGECDGTATLDVTGGTAPYNYVWVPAPGSGQGTATVSGLCAGNYNATVTDANGCVDNIAVTITEPPALNVTISASTDVTVNGGSNGTADATGSGGTPGYTFEWFNGCPPGATTGQTGTSATNLSAGTYSVVIADNKGCLDTTCVTINEPNTINTVMASTDALCNGACDGSASVTASGGVGGFTYQWHDGTTNNPLPGQTGVTASNLCAGDYYVVVTDANGGTTTSQTVTVNEPTAISGTTSVVSNYNGQDVSCNGACDGSADIVAGGGTPGYLFQWDDPANSTTATINNLCAGNYNVIVTDFNGCTGNFVVTITEPAALSNVIAGTDASCFGVCDGTASATPAGGTAPYTYLWNDPALSTTQNISNLCDGTYDVVITDDNGCIFNDQITITEPIELILASSTVGSNCGQTDGSATISVTQGTPNYTYQWDAAAGNQTTATASNLGFGCYDVTVTDGNGCTATETVCVQDLGAPSITPLTINDVSCNAACDGFAQVQVSGGVAPYNYQWFDGNNNPVSGISTTPSLGSLCAGTYTAEMTDDNGCVATTSITINEPLALNGVIQASTDVTCFGDCDGSATVLASGGTAPYTYAWNDPAAQTTTTASNLCPGTYNVSITDANNCTFSMNVTIGEPLQIILSTSDVDAFCNTPSGSASVTIVQGGSGNLSYAWNPTGQSSQTASNLTPGVYTVTVTDQDGCTANANATVGNIPPGVASISALTHVSCNGGSDGTMTVSMAGGTPNYTYEWYTNTGAPIGQTGQTATNLAPGDYFSVVTDVNGCTANSDTVSIGQPLPLAATFVIDSVSCNGLCDGVATATVSGGTNPYYFQWDNALNEVTPSAQGLCAQQYNVVITDDNGCVLNESVNVFEPNAIVLDSTVVNANCQQADGQACVLASGGTGAFTYSWPSGSTNSCDVNLAANTYIVDVTDANGCLEQIAVEVSDLSGPVASIIAQSDVSCFGGTDGSGTVDMTGGTGVSFTVQWDAAAGNQTTPTASNLAAGLYTVTITDNLGCSASTNLTINEPAPLQYVGNTIDASCFSYCDGEAWINVIGGTTPYAYSWVNNAGIPAGTNDTITGLCADTYLITVTDANGCTVNDSYIVSQPVQVSATISATNVTCNGACDGTATATGVIGVGAFTYLWDDPNAQTTPTATGLCPGLYTCIVTDQNGCFTTVNINITEPTQVTAAINISQNVNCFSACDGFAQVDPLGGTPGYTYSWDNNAGTNQIATNLCPNTYTATVTDANGCQATATVTITEPTALGITSNTTNVTCFNACNGTANVNVSGGTGPFSYQWDDPAFSTTPAVNNLCAGTYTCQITDALGCVISETVVITQPNELTLVATPTDANCGQSNGSICIAVVGGVAPFTYQWSDINTTTSACVNNIAAGCYTITIVDGNGCIKDSLLCINDIAGPTVTGINSSDVTCFGDQDGSVEFSVVGGTGAPTLELLDGNNNQVNTGQLLTNNLDGDCYTLIATDAAGCVGTDVICISEPNALNSAITSSADANCFLGCDGQATVSVSGGLPSVINGYTYTWNAGGAVNAATNTNLCAGNYTVVVTDSNNCTTTSTITINEPTQLLLSTANQVNVSCNAACDGSINVIANGATPPYLYNWAPNVSTGPTAGALCADNYDVTVTDGNGCVENINFTITEPQPLTLSASTINSTCSQCNGGASITVNGGTAPYTYNWLNGGNTTSAATNTGMCPGNHTVEVTDANGCFTTLVVTIIDEPAPTIDGFNVTQPTCNGLSNGSAEVLTSGGTGNLTYLWDAAAFNQVSNPAVALPAGNYCVTVSDVNNCQVTSCVTVNEPAPLLPVPDISTTICYGDSSQLWASGQGGTAPYTINWTTSGLTGPGPIMVTPLVTTTYCFTVTDDNGCLSPSGCVDITVLPPLDLNLTPSTSICSGSGIDLIAHASDGNGGPYTFDWTDENGNVLVGTQNADSSFVNVNPATPTWYYVTLSDGCSLDVIDSTLISINPIPSASISALDSNGCVPFTAQFIANSDIGVTYEFDFECDGIVDYSGPNSNPTFTYQNPGTYDVCLTVISADGCDTSISVNQMITVHPLPVADFTMNPPVTTALNPTITFTNMSSGGLIYDWDFGDGNTISGIDTAIIAGTNNGMTIGTYKDPIHTYTDTGYFDVTLTITNEFGCTDVVSYQVYVEGDYILFTPTAFTPNGDGKNDVFKPVGIGIHDNQYEMYIFDRWGQLIFESHDPDYGWDGIDPRSGRLVKLDVYVWLIRTLDHKEEPHEYIGHITVVR